MQHQKKLLYALFFLFTIGSFSLPNNIRAFASPISSPNTIDHAKDHKKAKKWAANHFTTWKKILTQGEENSLRKLLQPIKEAAEDNLTNINHQLNAYGGDISARAVDTPSENKNLQDHVDRISRAINRKEGQLAKPLMVYKNETLNQVIHTDDHYFRDENGLLIGEKINQLKSDLTYSQFSEFRIYDLFEDPNQDEMIKWKIELPTGTPIGLLEEDKIVVDRNSALKISSIKAFLQKGKQVIRIEAKLIPKEIVQNQINSSLQKIRNDFATKLQLPIDKTFINFKLTGSASHLIAHKIEGLLMDKLLTDVNHSVINKTLQFISRRGGHLIFTDRQLYSLPEVYEPYERTLERIIDMVGIAGIYNFGSNRTLSIQVPEDLEKESEIGRKTLFHEFGHAVDHYAGHVFKLNTDHLSDSPRFTEIFEEEGEALTEYASQNASEFFAEAFWLMHSPRKQVIQERVPSTHAFIKEILEFLAKNPIEAD